MNREHITVFNIDDIVKGNNYDDYFYTDFIKCIISYYDFYIYYNILYGIDKIVDLSLLLYKLHTKEYFCRYNHECKNLI